MSKENKKLEFTCPKCGSHLLENVLTDAIFCQDIKSINKYSGEIEYGSYKIDDFDQIHYRCKECGFELTEHGGLLVSGDDDLIEWLKAHQ